mmetsp:Transcript_30223/g.85384  ORF Transcript_30223/g.85384 Transcript_30223/m.85384 type:complete len:208 (+) Transcript_30223:2047-2670(+)
MIGSGNPFLVTCLRQALLHKASGGQMLCWGKEAERAGDGAGGRSLEPRLLARPKHLGADKVDLRLQGPCPLAPSSGPTLCLLHTPLPVRDSLSEGLHMGLCCPGGVRLCFLPRLVCLNRYVCHAAREGAHRSLAAGQLFPQPIRLCPGFGKLGSKLCARGLLFPEPLHQPAGRALQRLLRPRKLRRQEGCGVAKVGDTSDVAQVRQL